MPLYFAYGSNMSTARLKKRRLAPVPRGTASLQGHALRFHKRSTDGSGKADAHFTGKAGDVVHGVLYEFSEADLVRLDAIEGDGYTREERAVERPDGTSAKASVYLARPEYIDHALRPSKDYVQCLISGALEHGLPEACAAALSQIPTSSPQ